MMKSLIAATLVSFAVVACVGEADSLNGGRGAGTNGENGGDPNDPNAPGANGEDPNAPGANGPGACQGAPHIGFGNVDFVADRKPGELGENRRRVKPFTSLNGEFQRALGAVPPALAANAAAYGETPARWYAEPVAGAVSLYTTYTLAFTTCYDTMTQAEYQAAPTAATATAKCSELARKYWMRTPTTEEVTACSDLAVTGLATEPAPRRRWAHACASLLTSTGFTTY